MRYIDLFAGIGGFHYGINIAHPDWECVYSNEWDKYANSVYRKHFGECDNRDIKTVDASELPDFDLLCGGFPCQSFSIAGKRGGFDDTRGTLFFEIARIIKQKVPKYLLLENVKGLVSHDKGKTLEVILETLQELGYYTNIEVYNSKNFGVPQNRERIIFICRHIKTLLEDGQSQKTTVSKTIIQEYLFQILLNNLAEVKKLQEHNLKDSVVGYLLLKEINQNLSQSGENILDGIWTVTEEKSYQLEEKVWQNIDTWLKKNSEENYQELNRSTTLTAIKQIIELKTYTYSQMQRAILLAIVHLRESSKSLWKEVLLSLMVFQEDTKYERVNVKKEKVVITEGRDAYIGDGYSSARERVFIVGHLRGTPRPEVFPITGANGKTTQKNRVAIPVLTPDRAEKRQNGRRFKTDGEPAFTLTGQDIHGVFDGVEIRKLTPLECERLQGFPDDWTKFGINGTIMSDTQRYKMCGNAVTTSVVREIASKIEHGTATK